MKSVVINTLAIAALTFAGSTLATDMPELAKKNHCANCHAISIDMIGPSWMDVSNVYNNNGKTSIGKSASDILRRKSPEEWLKQKISYGGAGIWGTVLMPGVDPANKLDKDKLIADMLALSKGGAKEDFLKVSDANRCTACHALDQPGIGPSWMDISSIYNSNGTTSYGTKIPDILKQKTAEEWLMLKVSHGGTGNWGTVMMMPAMEYVLKPGSIGATLDEPTRDKDMKELVQFILGLAKK